MGSNYRLLALKCKIISLGLESKCIRAQEKRIKKQRRKLIELAASKNAEPKHEYLLDFNWTQIHIHQHRVDDVRLESRLAHWAYAFLRGQDHEKVESCPGRPLYPKEVERLTRMVASFTGGYFGMNNNESAAFKAWLDKAQARCLEIHQERVSREAKRAEFRAKRRAERAEQKRHVDAA